MRQANKNLVCKRPGLSELRIGPNSDVLFDDAGIELDLCGALACDLLVMTKEYTGDPQHVALHVELVSTLPVDRRPRSIFNFLHTVADNYSPHHPLVLVRVWTVRESSIQRRIVAWVTSLPANDI
jgi:hypothetical protein